MWSIKACNSIASYFVEETFWSQFALRNLQLSMKRKLISHFIYQTKKALRETVVQESFKSF